MKRAFLTAAAVLLALALIACEMVTGMAGTDTGAVSYTDDGRALVKLSISTGGGDRALTSALDKAGVDYYEVVFADLITSGKYYRTSWNKSESGSITVPSGQYDTAAKAMIFAGTFNNKTLLATGILSSATNNIAPDTTSVTFELTALTTDVQAATASSFKILTPSGYETASATSHPVADLSSYYSGYANPIPMFRVPAKDSSITASFTIGGFTSTWANVIAVNTTTPLKSSGPTIGMVGGQLATGDITKETTSAGLFNINITTKALTGTHAGEVSCIYFEVPVKAIAAAVPGGITWYIRGGTANSFFDTGSVAEGTGGAILLAIGNVTPIELQTQGP